MGFAGGMQLRRRAAVGGLSVLLVALAPSALAVDAAAATLTIVKDAQPDDPQDFDFDLTGSGLPADVDLDDDPTSVTPNAATFELTADQLGQKSITEAAVAGWSLTDVSCTEGLEQGATATVQVDLGDDITCTFTNAKDATVWIVKFTEPQDPADFAFTSTLPGAGSFLLDDDADPTLNNVEQVTVSGGEFGLHTITEGSNAGWSLIDITCTEGADTAATATIQVDPGDEIQCEFTNRQDGYTPPPEPSFSEGPSDEPSVSVSPWIDPTPSHNPSVTGGCLDPDGGGPEPIVCASLPTNPPSAVTEPSLTVSNPPFQTLNPVSPSGDVLPTEAPGVTLPPTATSGGAGGGPSPLAVVLLALLSAAGAVLITLPRTGRRVRRR